MSEKCEPVSQLKCEIVEKCREVSTPSRSVEKKDKWGIKVYQKGT